MNVIVVGKAELTAKSKNQLAELAAADLQAKLTKVGGRVVSTTSILDAQSLSIVAVVEKEGKSKEGGK